MYNSLCMLATVLDDLAILDVNDTISVFSNVLFVCDEDDRAMCVFV